MDQREEPAPGRARRGIPDAATATLRQIFAPDMRRRTIVGALIASAMMIGSWGTGTWLSIWISQLAGPGQAPLKLTSEGFMLLTLGGLAGYMALMWPTDAIDRRWSYFLVTPGAAAVTLLMFAEVASHRCADAMAAAAWHLRDRGSAERCARIVAAVGPFGAGPARQCLGSLPAAGIATTAIYVVGTVAIWFGPDHGRGRPSRINGAHNAGRGRSVVRSRTAIRER